MGYCGAHVRFDQNFGYCERAMTAVSEYACRLADRVRVAFERREAMRPQRSEPFAYFGSFGDDFFSDE